MSSMITCAVWVGRGVAKTVPDKVELSPEELEELIKDTQDKLRTREKQDNYDNKEGETEVNSSKHHNIDDSDSEEAAILEEYDLDNYDKDGEGVVMTGAGMSGLTYFANNENDPYITLKNPGDEDKEDIHIKPTDNLIVVGKVEDELSNIEIYVYNEEDNDLYVHHDILLDTFPLALECLNFDPEEDKTANLLAVGTMEPNINIWDLDIIDVVDPVLTLGNKKKKSKKNSENVPAHKDAVLDLSWNRNVRNILCSGSADSLVILWDMKEGKAARVLKQHKDKVQSVQWHPYEAQSLLTGSFDKTVRVVDCRNPESSTKAWKLHGEVERAIWNHFSPFHFLASTDKGCIYCCDVRMDEPIFTLHAHDEAISGIALSTQLPGCLVSVSQDKIVKVWDIENNKPSFVVSRDMKMGSILNVSCCPDSPYAFALGGEKQGLQIFDISQSAPAWKHFENRQCLINITNQTTGRQMEALKNENKASDSAAMDDQMEIDLTTAKAMETLSLKTKVHETSKKHKKKKKKK